MLAKANRVTSASDYRNTVRRGRRSANALLVTYVVSSGESRPVRFGFVVSKKVGNAVTRNVVRRRLKAASFSLIESMKPGTDVVFRALPASAAADFDGLSASARDGVTRSKALT